MQISPTAPLLAPIAPSATTLTRRLVHGARPRQLELVVRMAELGTVQKAAHALGMSQPSATQALTQLEALLDLRLFDRHARGVRLTQAGALLMPTIERVLGALASLGQEAVTVQQGADGLVRMAGISAATAGIAAQTLPELCVAHPHLWIDYREVDAAQIASLCTSGAVDVVLCRSTTEVASAFEFVPLRGDRVGVYCIESHPLARKKNITLQDCAHEQWLLPPDGSAPHRVFMQWCAQAELIPRLVRLTTRSLPISMALLKVMRCLYVGLESHMNTLVRDHGLHQLPLQMPAEVDGLGLLCRREGKTAAVEMVIQHLLQSFSKPNKQGARPATRSGVLRR